MIKEELIKAIEENVPDGAEVVLVDLKKNHDGEHGEGSSEGIYNEFEVIHFNTSKEDKEEGLEPFYGICFNDIDFE